LVIVNLPYPSTLQLNRFYTVEFFRMVRELLAEDGVLVVSYPGTLSYMSDELRQLNTMAYRTLQQVFASVRPIPDDLTLWLASPSDLLLTVSVEALVERWEERGLETQLMTAFHIHHKLDQEHLNWFLMALGEKEEDGKPADINQDLYPVGLFYGLSYWNALFSPPLARVLTSTGQLDPWMLSLFIIGGGLLVLVIVGVTAKGKRSIIPIVTATTGFTGMAADLIIIFAFQALYGYVYHWIGLLIAAFMAGLSLGGLLMTRRLAGIRQERSALLKLELALVLYWVLVPVVLSTLYAQITHPLVYTSIQGILLFLSALAGGLVGAQFPLANRMWLRGRDVLGSTAGVLYATDLVGAFLGSILVSVVLIPVLGILVTCLVAAILKVVSMLLVITLIPRS
jgi:spermidine synthase